ncbi:hypothetical protein ASE21_14565 [Flavobacterium sp. Root901]|uniref:hypothetical protein n=1 Tax=Flavobacterium sp. Root901 TaxID=1736605 RepID=UPI00070DAC86|nr:hypothetical protein [Flavobacterium sp. Root901]KRD09071.1 hypothetical protein ASE21_14565 [Flavobacterium sp. Root901]
MPSESQLEYKYGKLWVRDGFLMVFYIFLFYELKNDNKDFIELKKELAQNIDNISIDMFGFLNFNEFIISDEIKNILINHIENIILKMEEESNYFSLQNLDEILSHIKIYHLENLDYEPSEETIRGLYSKDINEVKNNYINEFTDIKSLLEKDYRI